MSERRTILVFGAGNIGRSFVGQLFGRAGWEVCFAEVDPTIVAALNERRGYSVIVRRQGAPDEELAVAGVRAVDGRDAEAVAAELEGADLAAASVGKAALPKIIPALAAGLLRRFPGAGEGWRGGAMPLDLILAENDREAADRVRRALVALLPAGFPLPRTLGLVETSIGKMVPLMKAEETALDRLRVYAEAYNSLIVDRGAFLGPVPELPGLKPVGNIRAYVDRKLFVHNLGHAAVAYLGYRADPSTTLIARALELPGVKEGARAAMAEAAAALAAEYPGEFDPAGLGAHIEDLLTRFANEALGDTVFRVGRDLPRKLDRSDRVLGAALLCEGRGLPWGGIARIFGAALEFGAADESGHPHPADAAFLELVARGGAESVLAAVCRLDPRESRDRAVIEGLLRSLG